MVSEYIIDEHGTSRLFNGKIHREGDLPAVVCDKEWCLNGKLHRDDDKPAIERTNGERFGTCMVNVIVLQNV